MAGHGGGGRSTTATLAASVLVALIAVVAWLWIDPGDAAQGHLASPRLDEPTTSLTLDGQPASTPTATPLAASSHVESERSDERPEWPAGVVLACVSGRVVDVRGAPWQDARVLLVPDGLTAEALAALPDSEHGPDADRLAGLPATRTDASGRFELCGPWQSQGRRHARRHDPDPTLAITAPGMAWQGHPVVAFDGDARDVGDLVLANPGSGFRLRVVDEHGSPLAGVSVGTGSSMYQSPADDDPMPPSRISFGTLGVTDADGRLHSDHHWPSTLYLMFTKEGYEQASLRVVLDPDAQVELGDVLLTRGASLTGRVRDTQGRPLVGAVVQALAAGLAGSIAERADGPIDLTAVLLAKAAQTPLRAVTGSDGGFVLGGIGQGMESLTLLASASGHAPARLDDVVPGSTGLALVLPAAGRLDVEVRDAASGATIADAELAALRRTSFAADGADFFSPPALALPVDGLSVHDPGALGSTLFASAAGYVPRQVEVEPCAPGEVRRVVIDLERGAGLHGEVVDDLQRPIPDAHVRLAPLDPRLRLLWDDDAAQLERRSGPDGRFRFDGLPAARWSIDARKDGHAAYPSGAVLDSTRPPVPWRIVLARGAQITGTLLDAGGAPVVGATIQAWRPIEKGDLALGAEPRRVASSAPPSGTRTRPAVTKNVLARTDRAGRFALVDLHPAHWTLSAEPGAETTVALDTAQQVEVTLRLAPAVRLRGRTHAGADDLPQVRIEARPFVDDADDTRTMTRTSTRSGVGGRYALELPGPGTYDVTFATRQGPRERRRVSVLPGDAPLLDVDFGTGGLAGRIVIRGDGETRPAPAHDLVGVERDGEWIGSSRLDDEGRFALAPLPAGSYRIEPRFDLAQAFTLDVVLAPGEVRDDLEIVLDAGALVSGRVHVVGDDDARFEGFVHLRRGDSTPGYRVEELDGGEFEFGGLAPGDWRLDLATFAEPTLGRGEGLRGEPGVELPLIGGRSVHVEAFEEVSIDVDAQLPP